jgi:chaperone LolA
MKDNGRVTPNSKFFGGIMGNKTKVYLVICCFGAVLLANSCASNQIIKEEKAEVKTATPVSESKTAAVPKKTEEIVKAQKEEPTPAAEATIEIKKEATVEKTAKAEPTAELSKSKKKKQSTTVVEKKSLTNNEQVDALIDRMNKAQSDIVATKANLTIKTIYSSSAPQVVKGTAIVKKKDKFNVHYTEPQEQRIVSNGRTIWVYTPAMQQVIKQTVESANVDAKLYTDMGSSIAHFARHSRTTLTEDDTDYTITMVPEKDKGIMYDEITARIDKKTLNPVFMGLKYEGAATEVTFTDTVNYTEASSEGVPELAAKNFTFVKPEGVEEIEAADLMQGLTK